ncbi:hypothetical protein ACFV23_31975 [Streptomyces sp. NPDC059627]
MGGGVLGRLLGLSALVAAAVLPQALGIAQWWHTEATRHPVTAAVLVFGYETVLAFAGRVLYGVGARLRQLPRTGCGRLSSALS